MGQNESQKQSDFMAVIEQIAFRKWIAMWASRVKSERNIVYTYEDSMQELKVRAYDDFVRYFDPTRGSKEGFISSAIKQAAIRIMEKKTSIKRQIDVEEEYDDDAYFSSFHEDNRDRKLLVMFVKCDLERLGMQTEKWIAEALSKGYNKRQTAQKVGVSEETIRRKLGKIRGLYEQD